MVGGHLLQMLLDDPAVADVVALTRRPLAIPHPKLVPAVVDFAALAGAALPQVDDFFCCLGTTMARAGSRQAFREVDLVLPLAIAEMALAAGATRCLYVSSMGADPNSRAFYSRVKGELERLHMWSASFAAIWSAASSPTALPGRGAATAATTS
ncbi:MAG: hypothetical protein IT521_16505 [Burkholderiales bacterium]|nr:hypothetical protein [Burkholderiales bacterium]